MPLLDKLAQAREELEKAAKNAEAAQVELQTDGEQEAPGRNEPPAPIAGDERP